MSILVIDANNLAHRVFHTPQASLTTKAGEPSGVILGVINSIKGLIERFPETTKVIMCWDGGRSKWRKAIYPEYKAQRDYGDISTPEQQAKKASYDTLWAQMDELHKILPVLGVHSIKLDGQEADDLTAAICRSTHSNEHKMVVTSDKDMLQLINDNVSVFSPYKGIVITPLNFYEETKVTIPAYMGYRALVGDTSDNIDGIPGIGEKTAQTLMGKYGHINNILNAVGEDKKALLKSKRTEKIFFEENLKILGRNHRIMNFDYADYPAMEELVNVSLSTPLEVNRKELNAILIKWQFISILSNYMSWILPFKSLGSD